MKIALLSGTMSTQLHGRFDVERLFEGRALTGSESSFFNIARGLRALGHDVDVYCDCVAEMSSGAPKLHGAKVHFHDVDIPDGYDATIASSEPDLLRKVKGGLRLVQQQLNDFAYCKPGFDDHVEAYVFASKVHAEVIGGQANLRPSKITHIPNSIDIEMVDEVVAETIRTDNQRPHKAVWCSSPDRGLHRLLEMWPEVRRKVPDATLEIYYRFDPWYESCKSLDNWAGVRARFIGECLRRLGRDGANGVFIRGPQSNKVMLSKLASSRVLPYTCEPIRFTEGFAVSVLDACATGCVPIISDVDALGDIYQGAAHIIPGSIVENHDAWVDAIVRAMTDDEWAGDVIARSTVFARRFHFKEVARKWEQLISTPHIQRAVMSSPRSASPVVEPLAPQETVLTIERKESMVMIVPVSHRDLELPEILTRMAAQGLTEQRTGVFGSRGRYYHYKFICSPMLNCHPSWWSLSDEMVVRDLWWHINPGDVVVDAGAAYGSYSLTALAMGASRIIAWTPEEHEALVANLHLNNWQHRGEVFSNGLWSRSGWLAIWPHAPKPQFFESKPETMPEGATALFPVVSMDDALLPMEPEKIDWFKMDVEGCEVEVLRGASQLVRKYRPKLLVENHLFKDAGIKVAFGALLHAICPAYKEVGTRPYATVSHSLWSV